MSTPRSHEVTQYLAPTGPGESCMLGLAFTACLALGLLLACVLIFPRLLYPPLTDREVEQAGVTGKDGIRLQSERLKLENDTRTTLLQGLGGAAVLLGVYFTFRQLRIARKGQVANRFTRAVDQLGHESPHVQLGGIYALQQISRDSAEERAAIHEILAGGRIRPAGLRLGLRTRLPATPESAHRPRADREYHNGLDGDDPPIERGGPASVPPSTVLGEEHPERSKGHWQRLLLLEHRICMLVLEEGLTGR